MCDTSISICYAANGYSHLGAFLSRLVDTLENASRPHVVKFRIGTYVRDEILQSPTITRLPGTHSLTENTLAY